MIFDSIPFYDLFEVKLSARNA